MTPDCKTFTDKKNYGKYNINFQVVFDNETGVVSEISVLEEGLNKYWQLGIDDGIKFGVARTQAEYEGCTGSFEQQIIMTTWDAGELLDRVAYGVLKKTIPGGKIKQFLIKKTLDKVFKAYNEKVNIHIGTLKTRFVFMVVNGDVAFVPYPPEEIERTGNDLYFDDDLSENDRYMMDVRDDLIETSMEMQGYSDEEINVILQGRKEWYQYDRY